MDRRRRSSLDRELNVLQVQLQTISRRELHVQKVLDDIQRLKDEVLNERLVVEEKISELEAQKEPINWLPPELLEHVFFAVTDVDAPNSNYRPQVVVSHVCMKWRLIALASPRLWSRIHLQGFTKPDAALTFLKRSETASTLEIDYRSRVHTPPTQQCCQMVDMIAQTQQHFSRVNYLSLRSAAALPLVYILPLINNHDKSFPRLRYLCLSITDPTPSFVEAPSLMESIDPSTLAENEPSRSSTSCLSRLKLEHVPLFKFPTAFIANLKSLELSYSPRRMNSTRHDYYLKMSSLCHFLAHTPLLEELVLTNTVPYFDVILATDSSSPDNLDMPFHRAPVKLDHLKTLEWSYPFAVDIYRFLSLIDAPGLEKLDLWVEDIPPKRSDTFFVRGYVLTASPHKYSRGIVNFSSMRDLSLQCVGEDTTSTVLRKFSFPALEKVAFTNVDSIVRQNPEIATALPMFPRLESIFRDPRLPSLTHLTLSHFKICAEQGRAEAMLGYMPVLTSLSVDSCSGVGRLMEGLQEKVVGTIKPEATKGKRRRRGVKVCPRLEALSFWGCQDVDFGALRAVVLSRNGSNNDDDTSDDHGADVQTAVLDVPKGAIIQTVTREDQMESDHKTEDDPARMGREIRPLRKLRRLGHEPPASMNIVSSFIAVQESLQPANIVYLRIANCRLIEEREASSLRDLGVEDVIWAGSDS